MLLATGALSFTDSISIGLFLLLLGVGLPVLLFGREFWSRVVSFEALVEEGVVSPNDLNIFRIVETAEEAWTHVCNFYDAGHDPWATRDTWRDQRRRGMR